MTSCCELHAIADHSTCVFSYFKVALGSLAPYHTLLLSDMTRRTFNKCFKLEMSQAGESFNCRSLAA